MRAGVTELTLQALAGALACHLHEPKLADLPQAGAGLVFFQRFAQGFSDLVAVGCPLHIDEIDDDEPTDVAQPELLDHDLGRLQVGLQHRLFLVALAYEAAGVDVDGGERLGVVDDDMPAGFEIDPAVERFGDLLLDVVVVEDRFRPVIELDATREPRHEGSDELLDALVVLRGINHHLLHVSGEQVADNAQAHVHVVVQQRRGAGALALLGDTAPELEQELHVVLHLFFGQPLTRRAHDEPAFGRTHLLHDVAQPFALFTVGNTAGDPNMVDGRSVHQVTAGQRNVRGQPRPLGPDRLLGHLHKDLLVLFESLFERDVRGRANAPFPPAGGWRDSV